MTRRPGDQAIIRIVDDDQDFLDGICFLLEAKGWQVAGYRSAQAFRPAASFSTSGCRACPALSFRRK